MKRFSSQSVPSAPGVYVFRNTMGDVIYVGKARSLRKRLATYFRPSQRQRADPKLRALVNSIGTFEVLPVRTEAEALLLESRLIKEYAPRYNVELRDDKRFLLVCLDPREPFPRLTLARLRKDDGRLYFGPFPRAGVLRETVRYLSARFGLRTCRAATPDAATRRHCLDRAIRACSCPCDGRITRAEYAGRVNQVLEVLRGDSRQLAAGLAERMQEAAAQHSFEEAARLRDMIDNLRLLCDPLRRTFSRDSLEDMPKTVAQQRMDGLQKALGLPVLPRVIDCFDISNIRSRLGVGSLVRFVDGSPVRKEYRRYRIRRPDATDDTAMMREVVTRRYQRVLAEKNPMPDLVVLDGGPGQLQAALQALAALGVPPLAVLALAKKQEEIYLPWREEPVRLSRQDLGLRLLQSVRDEAHRFAIAYHRILRRRRILASQLQDIEGVGDKRYELLLRAFGSVRRLRSASPEEIATAVPGLGRELATRVHSYLTRNASVAGGDRGEG